MEKRKWYQEGQCGRFPLPPPPPGFPVRSTPATDPTPCYGPHPNTKVPAHVVSTAPIYRLRPQQEHPSHRPHLLSRPSLRPQSPPPPQTPPPNRPLFLHTIFSQACLPSMKPLGMAFGVRIS